MVVIVNPLVGHNSMEHPSIVIPFMDRLVVVPSRAISNQSVEQNPFKVVNNLVIPLEVISIQVVPFVNIDSLAIPLEATSKLVMMHILVAKDMVVMQTAIMDIGEDLMVDIIERNLMEGIVASDVTMHCIMHYMLQQGEHYFRDDGLL